MPTPSTTTYRAGDVLLVAFPHTSGSQSANRPALVILDMGDVDVVLARVTTRTHNTPHDVALGDWKGAGLIVPSVVRLHKLATIEKSLVKRRLGELQPADRTKVSQVMRNTYGNW
jgi:mRNA interferase MazF